MVNISLTLTDSKWTRVTVKVRLEDLRLFLDELEDRPNRLKHLYDDSSDKWPHCKSDYVTARSWVTVYSDLNCDLQTSASANRVAAAMNSAVYSVCSTPVNIGEVNAPMRLETK